MTNDHPALHGHGEDEATFQADNLAKWMIMLPQVAVRHFQLEPNFNDGEGDKELWVGRMWQFRRILWLQYKAARSYEVHLSSAEKAELAKRYAVGTAPHAALLKIWYIVFFVWTSIGRENGIFFECFPYVCPEPVLVKSSF